ncbi:hypothetical protein ACFX13_023324 [Malus domestica]
MQPNAAGLGLTTPFPALPSIAVSMSVVDLSPSYVPVVCMNQSDRETARERSFAFEKEEWGMRLDGLLACPNSPPWRLAACC